MVTDGRSGPRAPRSHRTAPHRTAPHRTAPRALAAQTEGDRLMASAPTQEVEAALAAFPGLAGVTVVEQEAKLAGHCLVAYVAPGDHGIDMPALHAYARKLLPGGMVPAAIVLLDEIPVTAGGRIDRPALPVPDLGGLMPYRPPGTARQETFCEIFAEVLRMPRIGIDDDFFNLGGQSVEAMLLAGRINAALGVGVSMADLFAAATVAELDQRLFATANAAK
jgi:hypothetical protein